MSRRRRLLFVCSANRLRSPTAATICQGVEEVEALSAGTDRDAARPLAGELIDWADIVFVMERHHRNRVTKKFRDQLRGKPLVVLHVPDEYEYMQPELVALLKARLQRWLGPS